MKITIITDEEFLRIKSNLTEDAGLHFAYGLSGLHIFGRKFVVDEKICLLMSWRNAPFVEYRITDDYGYHWRIPEWLVADINNDEEV